MKVAFPSGLTLVMGVLVMQIREVRMAMQQRRVLVLVDMRSSSIPLFIVFVLVVSIV
jgi:hypothetical protein